MIKLYEEIFSPHKSEFYVNCRHCDVLVGAVNEFESHCEICGGSLPYYSDLIDLLSERMLYFEIGELWEEDA